MKILNIDSDLFLYPENIENIDDFANYINDKKYIKLKRLFEINCVHPYYIFEQIKDCYINSAQINSFYEDEIVIMNNEEYERHLNNIAKKLCVHCVERDNCLNSPKEDYREKLCLDCSCFEFCED